MRTSVWLITFIRLHCEQNVCFSFDCDHCSDLYGSVLWDLSHNAIESICIGWRNGRLMAPVCGFPPVRDELVCQSASFIAKCLQSENSIVHSVSRNGVFCRRMLSPIGMNAHFVCDFYDVSVRDISVISKSLAWSVHNDKVIGPELDKIDTI